MKAPNHSSLAIVAAVAAAAALTRTVMSPCAVLLSSTPSLLFVSAFTATRIRRARAFSSSRTAVQRVQHPRSGSRRRAGFVVVGRTVEKNSRSYASTSSSSSGDATGTSTAEVDEATLAQIRSSIRRSVSRKELFQTLLGRHGAPGSKGCSAPGGDLVPVPSVFGEDVPPETASGRSDEPELIRRMAGTNVAGMPRLDPETASELSQLHPYLYPIAKSRSTGHYVCAYRNPFVQDSEPDHPWPIVETAVGSGSKGDDDEEEDAYFGGFELLALNSEHYMRRIVAMCDFQNNDDDDDKDGGDDSIDLYNAGLGTGDVPRLDAALDRPYPRGDVAKLGYGADKYALLRIGPFPDLYDRMVKQHSSKRDEASSLIAAETRNAKLPGFGSNFAYYASVLDEFNRGNTRRDEIRDAARTCLRLPLPTVGMSYRDLRRVATYAQLAEEGDSMEQVLSNLRDFYDKIQQVEQQEQQKDQDNGDGKTPKQLAIDEAQRLIDYAVLDMSDAEGGGGRTGARVDYASLRPRLASIYEGVGMDDMALFVNCYDSATATATATPPPSPTAPKQKEEDGDKEEEGFQ